MKNLPSTVVRLECGEQQASAFFVTPTLVITANHSLIDHLDDPTQAILLHVPGIKTPLLATLNEVRPPETEDVAILRVTDPVSPDLVLPLRAEHLSRGVRWRTYGFPLSRDHDGAALEGSVAGTPASLDVTRDIDLSCDRFRDFSDYRGFSGAPVIQGNSVVGILLESIDGGLTAISVHRLRRTLDAAEIAHESEANIGDAPKWLQSELARAVPNFRTFQEIEDAVHETTPGYVLVAGSPGSGKTLISAGFRPSNDRTKVLGRYFCDVRGGELAPPPQYFREASTFAEWLSSETALVSGNSVPCSKANELRELVSGVHANLLLLANECSVRGWAGVIFVDDAVHPTGISPTSLLYTLPLQPPPGIRLVLCVSNAESMRLQFPDLEVARTIPVLPLELYDCELLARKHLGAKASGTLILDIAKASGGNPLLVTYLVREAAHALAEGRPLPEDILSLGIADVTGFYERQWRRIASVRAAAWLLGTIARLRGPVSLDILSKMLPAGIQVDFSSSISAIRHLLREDHAIGCYHASFRDFVLRQTHAQSEIMHDGLATFCVMNPNALYSCMNIVYHHLKGSESSARQAFALCDQQWADKHAELCIPSAYTLSDIDQTLGQATEQGDLLEVIKMLLLSSRVNFRYATLFSEVIPNLIFVVLAIRGTETTLRLIMEHPRFLDNPHMINGLIRRFVLEGESEAALDLFQAVRRRWVGKYEGGSWDLNDLRAYFEALSIVYPVLGPTARQELALSMQLLITIVKRNNSSQAALLWQAEMLSLPCAEALFTRGDLVLCEDNPAEENCAILAFVLERVEELETENPWYRPSSSDVEVDIKVDSEGVGEADVAPPGGGRVMGERVEEDGGEVGGEAGAVEREGEGAVEQGARAAGDARVGGAGGPRRPAAAKPAYPKFVRLDYPQVVSKFELLYRTTGVLSGGQFSVLLALCRQGSDPTLVTQLWPAVLNGRAEISVRRQNGVDTNVDALRILYTAALVSGYTGSRAPLDQLIFSSRHSWEKRFLSAIEWVGSTHGRWRALQREADSGLNVLEETTRSLLPLVEFTLAERSSWEDGYHLPEDLLPIVFRHTADLIAEFGPASADEFVSAIAPRFSDQCGLYTEGFRRALRTLADRFSRAPASIDASLRLRHMLFSHTRQEVLNRIERVTELLECADGFAKLNDRDGAERAFRCAIESSLGPSWYKEDQFSLLLDVLDAPNSRPLLKEQWRHVVRTLELASGELTFQRYVRSEKQRLIGVLASAGCSKEAAYLYLHYAHPPAAVQAARIIRSHADRTEKFSGLRFGVAEVDEQGGSLALLEGFKQVSPLKRWALVELFVIGDDRWLEDFARETCQLLTSEYAVQIGSRLIRCIRADFSPEKRAAFFRALLRADVDGKTKPWVEEAVKIGLVSQADLDSGMPEQPPDAAPTEKNDRQSTSDENLPPSPPAAEDGVERPPQPASTIEDGENIKIPGVFGGKTSLLIMEECRRKATECRGRGDFSAAREVSRKGLLAIQSDGWGIWSALSPAWPLLCELMSDAEDLPSVLRCLLPVIFSEHHASRWEIARTLVRAGLASLDATTHRALYQCVADHIQHMVQAEVKSIDVSFETDSITVSGEENFAGEALEVLLLRLLGHPNSHMRARVASVVYWLSCATAFSVRNVLSRAVSPEVGYDREISAGLLHALALKDTILLREIVADPLFQQMLGDPSIAVRYPAHEIIGLAQANGLPLGVPPTLAAGSQTTDPQLDPSWEWHVDATEILGCSDRADVLKDARQTLVQICAPLSPRETRDLWRVRCDGFSRSGNFAFSSPWEREAALRAVGESDDPLRHRRLTEHLLYNPLWPESDNQLQARPIARHILARLEADDCEGAFIWDRMIILHCREVIVNVRRVRQKSEVEVFAILVPSLYFSGHVDFERFFEERSVFESASPEVPSSILASLHEPAIARYREGFRVGGSCTPASPSKFLLSASNLPASAFERTRWQDGRVWTPLGIGPVCAQGSVTLMRGRGSLSLSGFELAWVVMLDGRVNRIVDPARNKTYLGEER